MNQKMIYSKYSPSIALCLLLAKKDGYFEKSNYYWKYEDGSLKNFDDLIDLETDNIIKELKEFLADREMNVSID